MLIIILKDAEKNLKELSEIMATLSYFVFGHNIFEDADRVKR